MATWTEEQLTGLARGNYRMSNRDHVVLSGGRIAEIMPFGIALSTDGKLNTPAYDLDAFDFDEGFANVDEEDSLEAGLGFGTIRDGGFVRGAITGSMEQYRERRNAPQDVQEEEVEVPIWDFLPYDTIAAHEQHDDVPEEGAGAGAGAGSGTALASGSSGVSVGEGHEIHYANIKSMGSKAIGQQRLFFFYDQLERMRDEFVSTENLSKFQAYFINATFSKKKENRQYGASAAVNFGTTTPDGESRRIPFNPQFWDFDILEPFTQVPPSAKVVSSHVVPLRSARDFENFLNKLKESLNEVLPIDSDSGAGEFANTRHHMMNFFLYKVHATRAAGPGRYDIDGKKGEETSFSVKSVFTPTRKGNNLCFWECLYFFLFRRFIAQGMPRSRHYDTLLHECYGYWSKERNRRRHYLTRFAAKLAHRLREMYFLGVGRAYLPEDSEGVDMNEMQSILTFFHSENPILIMDKDGDPLIGEIEGAETRRLDDDYFTGIWYKGHLHLVISYTGSLIVKRCRRCDKRFGTEQSLTTHLKSNTCMSCPCLGKGEHFDSESEWRFHMETRETLCPKYRLDSDMSTASKGSTDEEGNKLRFVNDKRDTWFSRKRDAQHAFDKDDTPMRNYKEAIYFDLESVVPMNASGTSTYDHATQIPYACGWILRSSAILNGEVQISYGKDCMKEFVDYLDDLYARILSDEIGLWVMRSQEGIRADPIPRKVRGHRNYSLRIKTHWDRYVKMSDSPACLCCGSLLETEHGYTKDSETGHLTFTSCAIAGFARNTATKNLETNFNDNAPRIVIWAHNGGKYDWIFLHRYLMEAGKLDELQTVRSSCKYFQLTYRGVFEFKDSLNFVMGSLDTLGKNFGVDTLKGIFPYRLLNSFDRIDLRLEGGDRIREMIPKQFLQISEKLPGPMGVSVKRDMNDEEYEAFFSERNWTYDVKVETVTYLKGDVMCLFGVVEKFRQGWLDMPESPELFKHCTIGQMCHSYFLEHYLEPNMYPCLDVCEDAYIRRALYGGRTEVFRRTAPVGSKIHYVDVNSLYPYVMESTDLPCGDPVWHLDQTDPDLFKYTNSPFPILTKVCDEDYFDNVMRQLNNGENSEDLFGFFEVDVTCNVEVQYPVLPERRSTDGDKTFKNMFTNMGKTKMVYYSEELKRAILYGCVVTKVYSFSKWQRGRVYGSLISVLKKQKLLGEGKDIDGNRIPGVAKNPSLRAAAKTAQNSLFGKTIQYIDESVQLVHTRERLFKAISREYSKVRITPVFRSSVSDVVEVTTKFELPRVQRRSCAALGTAILAEARLVLYDYFDMVQKVGGEILYCDTDSIVFAGETPLPDTCMDDSAYGKMKVEIDPEEISPGGFVGMSPKCYAFELKSGDPYVRCKGVNLSQNLEMVPTDQDGISDLLLEMQNEEFIKSLSLPIEESEIVTKGLSYGKMRELICGEVDVIVTSQMQFLKTTARQVSAYENVKLMRSRFDKRFLGSNGETFAWNDFNMNMEEIVTQENARALSDYLTVVCAEELSYLRSVYRESVFFNAVVESWLQSDSPNARIYEYHVQCMEEGYEIVM